MGSKHRHLEAVVGDETSTASPKRRAKNTRTSFVISSFWKKKCEDEAVLQGVSLSQIYMTAIAEYFDRHDESRSWDTTEERSHYDPLKFYTASQDKNGHSFHARVNLPKHIAGEVLALVQSGQVPQYRSVEDVLRDGLMHRVKQVAQKIDDGELELAADLAMLVADELQMVNAEEQAEELIAAVRANASRLISRGSYREAKRYLAEREDFAEALPPFHRAEFMETIKQYRNELETKVKAGRRGR